MDLPNVAGVEFRAVVDLKGYAVGSDGHIWSKNNRTHNRWRKMKVTLNAVGYPVISAGPKPRKQYKVHRLVAAAFIGICPAGHCVNHIDGVKANNAPANLEYVTLAENCTHAARIGLTRQNEGEANHRSKLTDKQIAEALEMLKSGKTQYEVAEFFGVAQSCISKYRRGIRRTSAGLPMGNDLAVPENRGGDLNYRIRKKCDRSS